MISAYSTHLIFARHGETAHNASGIFQGQRGTGLNTRGRAQAARLAARLGRRPPDLLYASDLARAVETANMVARACGLEAILDRDLREVDVGEWTGKSQDEVEERFPDEWAAWASGLDVRRGGGETYAELAERVERAVLRMVATHAGKRVLVVSHGGAIKSYVAKLLAASPEGLRSLAGMGNCGLTVIERDARGRSRLHAWNDTAHLEGLAVDQRTD